MIKVVAKLNKKRLWRKKENKEKMKKNWNDWKERGNVIIDNILFISIF